MIKEGLHSNRFLILMPTLLNQVNGAGRANNWLDYHVMRHPVRFIHKQRIDVKRYRVALPGKGVQHEVLKSGISLSPSQTIIYQKRVQVEVLEAWVLNTGTWFCDIKTL